MLVHEVTSAERPVDVVIATDAAFRPSRARASDAVFVLGLVAGVLLVAGRGGPLSAALLAPSLLFGPGLLWSRSVAARDRVEQLTVCIGLSIAVWMVVAHVLLSLQWWHPTAAVAVAVVASAAARWMQIVRSPQLATPTSTTTPTTTPTTKRSLERSDVVVVVVALGLWAISLPRINLDAMGDLGLLPVLPLTWIAALVLAVVGAARAVSAISTSGKRVAVMIAPILVILYGTLPAIAGTIRYPWAYKHVGVIRLLDETGRFHPDVDIYNNFSGFFGLGALVRGATGVDPTSYGAWFQLGAEAAILLVVWMLVRRSTDSIRVAHIATLVYLLTNWVGQNYFAAQTFGTFFGLLTLSLCFSWFAHSQTRRVPFLGRWLAGLSPIGAPAVSRATAWHRRVVIAVLFLALMMSHPLTPAAVGGAIGISWCLGWIRDRRLLALLAIAGLVWLLRCWTYFVVNAFDLGFGGSVADNADGNAKVIATSVPSGAAVVSDVTRLFSLGVWAVAALGVFLCWWTKRRVGVLLIAAAVPFAIPFVQSYGGEAIYRVYLYSLPLVAGLVGWVLVNTSPIRERRRVPQTSLRTSVLCLVLTAGFLVAHYGRERINHVAPSEVAMDEWIGANVAAPALVAQFADGYPHDSTASYPGLQVNDTYLPLVVDWLDASSQMPPAASLSIVADDLTALTEGTAYVVVSPGMIDSIRATGQLPISSTAATVTFLTSNPRFRVVHQIDDSWLLAVSR